MQSLLNLLPGASPEQAALAGAQRQRQGGGTVTCSDGCKLAYQKYGRPGAPLVVFIHGGTLAGRRDGYMAGWCPCAWGGAAMEPAWLRLAVPHPPPCMPHAPLPPPPASPAGWSGSRHYWDLNAPV